MVQVLRHPQGRVRQHRGPLPVRARRSWSHGAKATARVSRMLLMRWASRPGVPPAAKWRAKRSGPFLVQCFAVVCALVFLAWVGLGVEAIVVGSKTPVQVYCDRTGNACGVVSGFLSPFLAVALTTSGFLMFQYSRVWKPLRRNARKDPRRIVPTAGTVIENVVGRRELCLVIAQALRDRAIRRPYVLIGGVGAGKTAVLVRLTGMLAKEGAVPVPIRLRDADLDHAQLDFDEMAQRRFCEEVAADGSLSARHSERVWRQLRKNDKAVVIADGLEETFAADDRQKDRDLLIRQAIQRAGRQGLPLVIASRPHSPLEETEAAIIDLEPLSEEAALEYLDANEVCLDGQRMDWIVETAGVTESPLYLQILQVISRLRQRNLLEYLGNVSQPAVFDTRSNDRSTLRLHLLEAWETALVEGHLHGDLALSDKDRRRTVDVVSALACIGLLQDQLEVGFDQLIGAAEGGSARARQRAGREPAVPFPEIWKALRTRVDTLAAGSTPRRHRELLSLYAAHGEDLGLTEAHGERVRFPHSIVQAYLGSRFLDASGGSLSRTLEEEPGKELLIALLLRSRGRHRAESEPIAAKLLDAAEGREDAKAFDLYAAALQIDTAEPQPIHGRIAASLHERWKSITAGDCRTLDQAKDGLVHRFGEVLRSIGAAQSGPSGSAVEPAYEPFLEIAPLERSYAVRLAIAQEIGAGGDPAFDILRKRFQLPAVGDPTPQEQDPVMQYQRELRAQQSQERKEREEMIRETPAEQDPQQKRRDCLEQEGRHAEQRREIWRAYVMRAWLVPMMVGTVSATHQGQAKDRLRLWLSHLEHEFSPSGQADLPLSLEIALAQGFKSAANRRGQHPNTSHEARGHLVQEAETMLAHSRCWYSQLTLIHALCLWELPDQPEGRAAGSADHDRRPRRDAASSRFAGNSVTAEPSRAVERWLKIAGSKRDPRSRKPGEVLGDGRASLHPFVVAAAGLATLALETRHPERFIWIDEKGATDIVGSSAADPDAYRKHSLWIPASVGWSTLHPGAQQLLADVLLLLNLMERTGNPAEVEARMDRANRTDLPPCLTHNRDPLQPNRTVGMAELARPGLTCLRDCAFELCPYPAKGEQPRAELREAFCRQQQALLRPNRRRRLLRPTRRRTAPWQVETTRSELIRFWEAMATRERPRPPSRARMP